MSPRVFLPLVVALVVGVLAVAVFANPARPALGRCFEDMACFDCWSMGNRRCGPGVAP